MDYFVLKRCYIILAAGVALAVLSASASNGDKFVPIPNFGDDAEIANSVMIGTISAAYAVAVPVGSILGVAASPGAIAPNVSLNDAFKFGMGLGAAPVMTVGYLLAYALGGPLYAIETIFWDRPRSVFGRMSEKTQPFRYFSPDSPVPSRLE